MKRWLSISVCIGMFMTPLHSDRNAIYNVYTVVMETLWLALLRTKVCYLHQCVEYVHQGHMFVLGGSGAVICVHVLVWTMSGFFAWNIDNVITGGRERGTIITPISAQRWSLPPDRCPSYSGHIVTVRPSLSLFASLCNMLCCMLSFVIPIKHHRIHVSWTELL